MENSCIISFKLQSQIDLFNDSISLTSISYSPNSSFTALFDFYELDLSIFNLSNLHIYCKTVLRFHLFPISISFISI